ncbi:MAG: hypothetical protein ACFFCM_04150 [Promethearchaeota archaeon]
MNLIFKNFRLIDYKTINELNDIQKEQMLIVGKQCFDTPGDEFIDSLEDFLDQTYEGNCELWEVVNEENPKRPIYDVWVVNVDTAVVFFANTTKDTGVGMIQNDFDPLEEDTEEARKLAVALQTAFKNRPKIDYLPPGAAKAYHDAVREIQKAEEEEKTKKPKKKTKKAK